MTTRVPEPVSFLLLAGFAIIRSMRLRAVLAQKLRRHRQQKGWSPTVGTRDGALGE